MNYATIKFNDIANGLGVRTSLFVSGCTHYCKGCFNSEAWSFDYGKPFTKEVEDQIIASLKNGYVDGLSLLGGEPFEPQNQKALLPFLKRVKSEVPTKNIWCYTGYLFDSELLQNSRAKTDDTLEILKLIDVLVDGKFVEELKDISLMFKGSSNQRIIDVKQSLQKNEVILYNL
ncbi:MAG: anaerobic ribonucleoside-triphosphate reductase activating protein [Clostridia bacterium]|nr:anaerobic ribonucleoside-triphosphate reductase activating protein [Clostridia bacterium]